jgi:hypothetical protein
MIQLIQGQEGDIVLTLTEKTTLTNPYYLFVFTHETTKEVISFIKSYADDTSLYPNRFNEFIFASTLFATASIGKYIYQVYEQASSTNKDVALTTSMIENGKMDLNKSTSFTYPQYSAATTYKAYGG